MSKGPVTLTSAANLTNLAQLEYWVTESERYLANGGVQPAPFPDHLKDYIGCDALMQELPNYDGKRIGRITLSKDGDVRYMRDWPMD